MTGTTGCHLPGGTAGLLGFAHAAGLKATAIRAGAHPAGAGLTVLHFVRQLVKDGALVAAALRAKDLTVHYPDLDGDPDPEDVQALKSWIAEGVNPEWPVDWWTLLAKTQGDPDAILTAGHMVGAADFAADSLLCEWGYVINFRAGVLEVYRGNSLQPPTAGRWAGEEFAEEQATREMRKRETGKDYYAINEVARFPFERLPTDEAFLTHLAHLL